ncbi:putative odorant receptor 83c [Drosophila tropicalis]|uniref:putative odorant receptor 83c n=1 Tax=Drosophila tropicalis TaxID=46794 RepID=UPI0035AC01C9
MSSNGFLPSESFKGIMRFVRFIGKILGADIYVPNYRFNVITTIVTAIITIYISFTVFTVIEEMNWMFGLQACCMIGSAVQGVNKLYTGVSTSRQVYDLMQIITGIYEEYEIETDPEGLELYDDSYKDILWQSLHRTKRSLIATAISYILAMFGMVGTPLIAGFVTGNRYMIMHFRIPGVDPSGQIGYILTQSAHALCICCGAFGLYAGDICIIIYLLQSFIFADILRLKVRSLNLFVEEQSEDKYKQATKMLTNIIEWQQKYQSFVCDCNDVFYSMVSVQITTSAVCIVLTIFVTLTTEWLAAYPYLICIIPNMYLYCILGTLLENCNDDIMYEIYNISFYNLSAEQQRMVLFMLAKSQRPETIQLLGVLPLAVSTALAITKNIYSITMMMVQFLMK